MAREIRHSAAVIGAAAGVAAALLLLLLLALLLLLLRRRRREATSPEEEQQQQKRLRKFSYRELKSATANFSGAAKLGQGGFGSVFKGVLRGGECVAVKRLDPSSSHAQLQFANELRIAASLAAATANLAAPPDSNVAAPPGSGSNLAAPPNSNSGPPPNLVAPLGFCLQESGKRKRRRKKKLLLVYELMANRSLQEALFDDAYPVRLDWRRRHAILVDVARALAFLHSTCQPPIVHGDVKPSNVLLDAHFSAFLADLGLARHVTSEVADHVAVNVESPPPPTEDDEQSTAAYEAATEGDTWSKASPSDVDCRSEVSVDSNSLGGSRGPRKLGFRWPSGSRSRKSPEASGGSISEWVGRNRKQSPAAPSARSGSLEWWTAFDDSGELDRQMRSDGQGQRKAPSVSAARLHRRSGSDESFTFYRPPKSSELTGGSGALTGVEWWSGELTSSGRRRGRSRWRRSPSSAASVDMAVSTATTPSMRGTVCYVAPECGGVAGSEAAPPPPSAKWDVYSFGVLLLVVVSGRRPLQLLASPLSEFERANLVSWARHAGRAGRHLDLVDPTLTADEDGGFQPAEAATCVSLALLCLHRHPASRPAMPDVAAILTGQQPLPPSPSPSPPPLHKRC